MKKPKEMKLSAILKRKERPTKKQKQFELPKKRKPKISHTKRKLTVVHWIGLSLKT